MALQGLGLTAAHVVGSLLDGSAHDFVPACGQFQIPPSPERFFAAMRPGLVDDPDRALDADIAALVLQGGMREGCLTGG